MESSPAVVAGVVYVGSGDSYVYALDAGAIDSRLRGNDVMTAGMTEGVVGMM